VRPICTNEPLVGRFAALRVRHAGGNAGRARLRPLEWLLIEWPAPEQEPSKYVLSTLPEDTPINELVAAAHQRWRIERDYQDLKQDFGLGHYEGRGWRGFHHHASLSIAAYGFPACVFHQGLQPRWPNRPKRCAMTGCSVSSPHLRSALQLRGCDDNRGHDSLNTKQGHRFAMAQDPVSLDRWGSPCSE
jgi:hypothetical protein